MTDHTTYTEGEGAREDVCVCDDCFAEYLSHPSGQAWFCRVHGTVGFKPKDRIAALEAENARLTEANRVLREFAESVPGTKTAMRSGDQFERCCSCRGEWAGHWKFRILENHSEWCLYVKAQAAIQAAEKAMEEGK